ncbi:MAG: 4-hydroxy-tetrahydrodipicolinate synthase [Candidatus Kapabacteria bacterium]|nr:4-hydroxy-tetrahydrodipicolinate synthase [Candidatus Kapabacteria bacterium]
MSNLMRGLHTAIVTPFTSSGDLDLAAFRRLIDLQLAAKVDGIVVCGSTGEGATLSIAEKTQLWETAVAQVGGRCVVTAGTGTNDTRSTIELTSIAATCGVDAVLLVTPYYNKPTPAGLLAHFRAINDAVDVPQIIYNVPGRTGQNVTAATQIAIAQACPRVIATKEASANLEQMCEIIRHAPPTFALLAGDDVLTLPAIACGAAGVIAVISNYAGKRFRRLVHAALDGDLRTAQQEQMVLMPYFAANFIESNPIPVKQILQHLGHIKAEYRLPLTKATVQTQGRLQEIMQGFVDE